MYQMASRIEGANSSSPATSPAAGFIAGQVIVADGSVTIAGGG